MGKERIVFSGGLSNCASTSTRRRLCATCSTTTMPLHGYGLAKDPHEE